MYYLYINIFIFIHVYWDVCGVIMMQTSNKPNWYTWGAPLDSTHNIWFITNWMYDNEELTFIGGDLCFPDDIKDVFIDAGVGWKSTLYYTGTHKMSCWNMAFVLWSRETHRYNTKDSAYEMHLMVSMKTKTTIRKMYAWNLPFCSFLLEQTEKQFTERYVIKLRAPGTMFDLQITANNLKSIAYDGIVIADVWLFKRIHIYARTWLYCIVWSIKGIWDLIFCCYMNAIYVRMRSISSFENTMINLVSVFTNILGTLC